VSTLLLRLAAPLQSWGAQSRFGQRDTQRFPTKSGVVGLLAAALGRDRTQGVSDLDALVMGVRADQAGELLRDYHTAVPPRKLPYITNRYYLCDAVFLVGLEGEEPLLAQLAAALRKPAFPLFLGRRACPPSGRLLLGLRPGLSVQQALSQEPWLASAWYRNRHHSLNGLQVLLEVPPETPGAFFLRDAPVSFSQDYRQHGFRSLAVQTIPLAQIQRGGLPPGVDATQHDAFGDWGD